MLRDVFYYGDKPNVHPRERFAKNLADARSQSTTEHFWIINEFCDYRNFNWDFDFDFLPDEDVWTESHINVWPSQHQKDSGTWLCNTDNVDAYTIYRADVDPIKRKNEKNKNWVITTPIDETTFDFSWHPDPTDPPYIYQFPSKWSKTGGPKFLVEGATEIKYEKSLIAIVKQDMTNWSIPEGLDTSDFDFSWHPDLEDKPYTYHFGTQWQKTDGPTYTSPGSAYADVKYIDTLKAKRLPNKTNWIIPEGFDESEFDFSWHPDATSPPYIYQFGTIADPDNGPRYIVPGATEVVKLEQMKMSGDMFIDYPKYFIETTLEDLISKHPIELFWALNPDLDYSDFDFTWRPNIEQANYVHAFGSEDNINTQTYFVNAVSYNKGFTEINYVENKMEVKTKIDMYFVDRGNSESKERFEKLKEKYGNIQKTRYLNSWVDTINRCINRSTTDLCWILNSELDYTNFEFDYYPNPWQMKMVHVFGTQWSHWGTTFMVNKTSFPEDTKHVKIIEHLSNLNFVKTKPAVAVQCLYDVYLIDHGNKELSAVTDTLTNISGGRKINVLKYNKTYLDTFKDLVATLEEKREHYIWVCSSICDYSGFDFSYICDPYAKEQLHVFPSNKQRFGDTFLVDVNKLRDLIRYIPALADYNRVNFNQAQRVKRLPAPIITTSNDTHCEEALPDFDFPYAILQTSDNADLPIDESETLSLWATKTKNILITSTGGTRIVVPREAKSHIKKELYDYPYISKTRVRATSKPLDIVFLSNGEKCADENYEHLLNVTKGLNNRIVRVDGVNGRVAAYHAAATASNTPWMFTVFAKLKVSNQFDWDWQPDRLQVPKHYIFNAKNPVNGLVYGHQAMIAYNKKITLANQGRGLDFTQDDEHEVVDITSGIATFNVDEWTTWRTAFRESIKLCTYPDEISQERLKTWTTVANGDYAQYCLDGANDAVEYFDEVAGDFDLLRLSYDWAWLRDRFDKKYK